MPPFNNDPSGGSTDDEPLTFRSLGRWSNAVISEGSGVLRDGVGEEALEELERNLRRQVEETPRGSRATTNTGPKAPPKTGKDFEAVMKDDYGKE